MTASSRTILIFSSETSTHESYAHPYRAASGCFEIDSARLLHQRYCPANTPLCAHHRHAPQAWHVLCLACPNTYAAITVAMQENIIEVHEFEGAAHLT
jgi:hypothetical protein